MTMVVVDVWVDVVVLSNVPEMSARFGFADRTEGRRAARPTRGDGAKSRPSKSGDAVAMINGGNLMEYVIF